MTPDQKPAFAELLANVMAFYRQDTSPFATSVWWQACASFDLEQVRRALTAHAMDPDRGQFAPKPADIVRALQGTRTDRSLVAWGKVHDAIRMVGAYQSVAFDDGAIHAVVEDMGGWSAVCRTTVEELPFLQRRFAELHRVHAARPDTAWPTHLIGESEADNRTRGYRSPPPVLIGNPQAAQEVMRLGLAAGAKTQITQVAAAVPFLRIASDNAA